MIVRATLLRVVVLASLTCGVQAACTNVGYGNSDRKALDMLDLGHPDLDWVGLARSIELPGAKVTTMEAFNDRFAEGIATPGPFLVEIIL